MAGFRPFLSDFSLTQNFPKPEIRTSSPDSRVSFIMLRIVSTASLERFRGNPFSCWMASMRSVLVNVFGMANRRSYKGERV